MRIEREEPNKVAIVVTTIFPPTPSMITIAKGATANGHKVIVAGDAKGPALFELDGTVLLTLEDQQGFSKLGRRAPIGSYARKNLAYLWAMRSGVDVILETDDDNTPNPSFFSPRPRHIRVPVAPSRQWLNVYQYFLDDGRAWPRGLPLEFVQQDDLYDMYEQLVKAEVDAPIQQALADGNPDVDAVYRMTGDIPVSFCAQRRNVVPLQLPEHDLVSRCVPTYVPALILYIPNDRHMEKLRCPANSVGK